MGHVIVRLESEGIINIWGILTCNFIYSFHVPLLFVLSGICFSLAYSKGDELQVQKIRTTIKNNALLYLIWSFIFLLYKLVFSRFTIEKVSYKDALSIPIIAQSSLWYIYILVIAYVLVVVAYKRKATKMLLQVIVFVACILMPFNSRPELEIYTIFRCGYIFFFIIGMEFGKLFAYLDNITEINARQVIRNRLGTAAGFLGVFSFIGLGYEHYYLKNRGFSRGGWSDVPIVGLLQAVIFSSFIIVIAYMINNKRYKCSVLEYLGKNSLEIYILHMFIFTPVIKIFIRVQLNYALVILITSVLTVSISLGISWILRKVGMWQLFFKPYSFLRNKVVYKNRFE